MIQSNIYLIGYRGAGKTEVAAELARRLQRDCFSVDRLIQQSEKKSISQIFATEGEERFRQLESEMIRLAASQHSLVVDLGGGAITRMTNRQAIANTGKCVWLRAEDDTLWSRIQSDARTGETRPALTSLGGFDELQQVLREREPVYAECADFEIATDQLSPAEVAAEIVDWFSKVDI